MRIFAPIISLLFSLLIVSLNTWAQDSDVVDMSGTETVVVEVEENSKKQTTSDTEELNSPSDKWVEKLEVTGSYIRRIDVEGPSPVVTFDQEDFNQAGVDTVSDYLKESPLFGGSIDSGNRDGQFRFRGQHAGSTLVLINGLRLPKLGGPDRGFFTGVESIPTNIIERVEVLKDGSSALYGSDAMAGVMNFITKKDYDGAEFSTRVNVPEINQGIQQNHTIAFGKSYARGSWFLSTQYVEQRGYTEADVGNRFSDGILALNPNSSGQLRFFNGANRETVRFRTECPENDPNVIDCETDNRSLDFVREPRENIGTLLTGQIDVTPDINLSMVGMYNRRRRMDIGRPNRINISERDGFAPLDVSNFGSSSLAQQANGNPLANFSINPLDEVGTRRIEVLQNAASAQSKLEGYFLDSWTWNLSGSYAYSLEERDHQNGLVSVDGVRQAFANGYDPTAVGQNTDAFAVARIQGTEAYEASMSTGRLLTTGELFEMSDLYGAGGPVSMAFGIETQYETTNDAHDEILINNPVNQIFEPNIFGSRSVNSVFAEFVAYPLESLEVQVAGRYDNYSDFGDTFNPKVSMGWRPTNKTLIRASWGTNFNAPSLRNMIQRGQVGFEGYRLCPVGTASCRRDFISTERYRDENLSPELGTNYNIGTVIQPNKNWTFTFDQWNFEGQNSFVGFSSNMISDLYPVIGEEGLADAGITFGRDADGNIDSVRSAFVTNVGSKTIRGIDFGVNFFSPVKFFGKVFKFGVNFDHTHMLVVEDRRTDTAPPLFREDLEWKNTTGFNLSTRRHSYRLAARTVAGDTTRTFRGVTRTHTEYDLNYNYSLPWGSARLALGVKNVLDSRPPVDLANPYIDYSLGYNAYAFNALGRRYYMGYSQSF